MGYRFIHPPRLLLTSFEPSCDALCHSSRGDGCCGQGDGDAGGTGIPNQDPSDIGQEEHQHLFLLHAKLPCVEVIVYANFFWTWYSALIENSPSTVFSPMKNSFHAPAGFLQKLPTFSPSKTRRRFPLSHREAPTRPRIPPHPKILKPAVPNLNQLHPRSFPWIKIAPRSK